MALPLRARLGLQPGQVQRVEVEVDVGERARGRRRRGIYRHASGRLQTVDRLAAEQPRQAPRRWERERGGRQPGQAHRPAGGPAHLLAGELPAHVAGGPVVVRERRPAEVGVVDLDLPPAVEGELGDGLRTAERGADQLPPLGRHRGPGRLELPDRAPDVLDQGRRGPAGAGLDVAGPLLATAGVALGRLAPRRGLQHVALAVRVASEVGEHVADGPAGEQRRSTDLGVLQGVEVGEEPLVRRRAALDGVVELPPGPVRPGPSCCPVVHAGDRTVGSGSWLDPPRSSSSTPGTGRARAPLPSA